MIIREHHLFALQLVLLLGQGLVFGRELFESEALGEQVLADVTLLVQNLLVALLDLLLLLLGEHEFLLLLLEFGVLDFECLGEIDHLRPKLLGEFLHRTDVLFRLCEFHLEFVLFGH